MRISEVIALRNQFTDYHRNAWEEMEDVDNVRVLHHRAKELGFEILEFGSVKSSWDLWWFYGEIIGVVTIPRWYEVQDYLTSNEVVNDDHSLREVQEYSPTFFYAEVTNFNLSSGYWTLEDCIKFAHDCVTAYHK